MTFFRLLKISRPRFWIYLLGPFLVGIAAAGVDQIWLLVLLGLYFTFPANLLVYGINDIFDYETDKNNPKKQGYEELVKPKDHRGLLLIIAALNIPVLLLFPWLTNHAIQAMLWFWFFGIFYSAPPVRAKAIPIVDSIFNVLYVFPGVAVYSLLTDSWPPKEIIVAAALWTMAMHAFSALPDMKSDKKAKIETVATKLGYKMTLFFCIDCYIAAGLLIYPHLGGMFTAIIVAIYLSIMTRALIFKKELFQLYKAFPIVNLIVGFALFVYVQHL
ncbi:MAG: prenyltransferase [bacterium]|nr:prenyltransferase [bacterium]